MADDTEFLVGTASWTDPTLVESDLFYPPSVKTAEERLRFYAGHFNTVEVDSTYYALLAERTAQAWVERTPPRFKMNLKAFAMLTQHPVEVARLPRALKELLPRAAAGEKRLTRPPPAMVDLAFEMFNSAAQPLRTAEKLGMMLFQFPPYFTFRKPNLDYLDSLSARLPDTDLAIEFRHPSWLVPASRREETMDFLRRRGLYYVSVDAPTAPSIVPSLIAATGPQLYVRFHGRNAETWFKRGISAAERYKYLYAERELAEKAEQIRKVPGIRRAYVLFNNCYAHFGVMNATTMAQILSHPSRTR